MAFREVVRRRGEPRRHENTRQRLIWSGAPPSVSWLWRRWSPSSSLSIFSWWSSALREHRGALRF